MSLQPSPPQPIPESLWGQTWTFVGLPAEELEDVLGQRPIPIRQMPTVCLPSTVPLARPTLVPGMVIEGGRQAMRLARWIQAQGPVSLMVVSGLPGGVTLRTGTGERWVLVTYDDPEVAAAATVFHQRLQASHGVHFLLVQPDDSGVTQTGLWVFNDEAWNDGV